MGSPGLYPREGMLSGLNLAGFEMSPMNLTPDRWVIPP